MGVYHDTALTNGTTYYYTVTAVNAVGESVDSSQVVEQPSSAPVGAAAAAFTTRVQLVATATKITAITAASAAFKMHTKLLAGASVTSGTKIGTAAFKLRNRFAATPTIQHGPVAAVTAFKTRFQLQATGTKVTYVPAQAQFALNNRLRATANVVATVTSAPSPKGVQQYRVVMVNKAGVPQIELRNAAVTLVELELNQPGSMTFTLPTIDPQNTVANISCWGNEVQVWRKSKLIFWGVPTRIRSTSQTSEFQCSGLMVHFQKRNVGKANRDNLLANPSFEDSVFTGWFGPGLTGAQDSTHIISGAHSLRLDQSVAGQDTSWQQNVGNLQPHTYYLLSASAHIWADVGALHPEYQLGPAVDHRGLYIELHNGAGSVVGPGVFATLDYPAGVTQRLTISINTDVLGDDVTGAYLNVRLYAVGGITMWDACELVTMESLSFQNVDQARVLAGLVTHAQDPAFSKSDLAIQLNCPDTGVLTSVAYQWADHGNIFDSMSVYNKTLNGLDMDVVFDVAGTQRVFTTFHPHKGTTRTAEVLEFQKNTTDFTFDEDGDNTSNSIIELGDGSGPDRYEGFAIDTGATGGLTLELVESAPAGTSIDALYQVAASRLAQTKNIVMMPEVTVYDTNDMPLIGVVGTGDVIPVRVSYGRVQYQGSFRIVKMSISPQNDSIAMTLNTP